MSVTLLEPPASAPPTDRLVTGEELLLHPEWGPCELIRGKVVRVCRPNNEHGLLMGELSLSIGAFVRQHQLGMLFVGDSGVYLERNPDTLRGPDLHFLAAGRWPGAKALGGYLEIAPDLCVEIASPRDTWSELEEKVEQYLKIGVKMVWVIDSRVRRACVFRARGRVIIPASGVLLGEEVLPGFELRLADLFAVLDRL